MFYVIENSAGFSLLMDSDENCIPDGAIVIDEADYNLLVSGNAIFAGGEILPCEKISLL